MVSRFLENLFIFQVQYTVPSLLMSSQSYGFSCGHVWMWELDCKESWALKNWCFWTVVLEKTLKVPWTARRFNQSILNDNSPEYSLKGLMLKMKLQYLMWCEELTHLKRPWCWERLKVGEEDNRGWDGWMASLTQWRWVWVSSRMMDRVMDREAWRAAVHRVAKSQTWLSDWSELKLGLYSRYY